MVVAAVAEVRAATEHALPVARAGSSAAPKPVSLVQLSQEAAIPHNPMLTIHLSVKFVALSDARPTVALEASRFIVAQTDVALDGVNVEGDHGGDDDQTDDVEKQTHDVIEQERRAYGAKRRSRRGE